MEFLEDLGNSEEFQEFLKEKQRKKDEKEKSAVVEVIEEVTKGDEEKYPLTQRTRLERLIKRRFEHFFTNRVNRQKVRLQEESIAKIKVS